MPVFPLFYTFKFCFFNIIDRINKYVAETDYTCSIGYSYHEEGTIKLEDLLRESDERMYSNKSDYYNNMK